MKSFGILAAIILALVVWYKLTYPSATIHYRMTVDVETPEGPKSGSGVIAITFGLLTGFIEQSFHSSSRGEAVFVALGPRGNLYALLSSKPAGGSDAPFYRFTEAFRIEEAIGPHKASSVRAFANTRGIRTLQAKQLPTLVKFRDEHDPKTVEAVDANNLAMRFGDGVRLKRITIKTTEDPVTIGINNRLSWLTEPAIIKNPGWANLPSLVQETVMGLRQP
jgi:hypothetical protein